MLDICTLTPRYFVHQPGVVLANRRIRLEKKNLDE